MSSRRALAVLPLVLASLALAGCVPPGPGPAPSSSSPAPSPSASASVTPTAAPPTATPAPTETPVPDGPTPVTLGCSDLVSVDDLYAFNPNYGALDDWAPAGGSLADQVLGLDGLACRWVNQTGGATFDLAIALPAPADLAALQSSLDASGTATSAWAVPGYFAGSSGQAIVGPYWLTAESSEYSDAVDFAPLVNAAASALG